MTTYLLSLWLLLSCGSCASSLPPGAAASFSKGNERLVRGDYAQAIGIYHQLAQQGVQRAELYCNMGNAYYKLNQVGWAIYYYEKGLALAPSDAQLLANKKAAMQRVKAPGAATNLGAILSQPSVLTVADVAAQIALVGVLSGSILFVISGFIENAKRKTLRVSGRYLLLVSSVVLLLAAGLVFPYARHQAIIVQAKATGRVGPSQAAKEALQVSAGEKVTVRSHYAGWVKVQTQQGDQGWITATSVANLTR